MSDVSPGWYDDGTGRQRWWDGTAWGPVAPPGLTPWEPGSSGEPPRGGRGAWPWLLVGLALVLVAGAAAAVVVLLRTGGDEGGGDGAATSAEAGASGTADPAATVRELVRVSREGDCDAVVDLLTREFAVRAGPACEQSVATDEPRPADAELGPSEVDGDRATVDVVYGATSTAPRRRVTYHLVRQGGEWLVDAADVEELG